MSVTAAWCDITHPIVASFLDDYGTPADGHAQGSSAITHDEMDALLLVASTVLNRLVGGKYRGLDTDRIRPNRNRCCVGQPRTGCRQLRELELPQYPVVSITSVTVDGVLVDSAKYRVDDRRWLVQLPNDDGQYVPADAWPCCQRTDLPPTEDQTMEVVYVFGEEAPVDAQRAAARLATELALADIDTETCSLNADVTSVARQGVTYILKAKTLIEGGGFGLADVDMWLFGERSEEKESPGSFIDPTMLARQGRPNRRPDYTPTTAS